MVDELSNQEFKALAERVKDAWDNTSATVDPAPWREISAEISLRNMCARWILGEDDEVRLVLEEHRNSADAFSAAHKNDGSIEPLRSLGFRQTDTGWEELT